MLPPSSRSPDLEKTIGLLRTLGVFSNFAVSFSIISVITGIATMYDYGLSTAGPREITLGWPIVVIGTLLVAASMAELCSAVPTSGAMYDWAAALGGPNSAWFAAWFNIIGLVAAVGGVDYGCARFLAPMLGMESKTSTLLLVCALVLLSHGAVNHFGIKLVGYLSRLSVTIEVLGVTVLLGALWLIPPKQPIGFLLRTFSASPVHAPYFWLFILGLLHAEWIFTGYDASAHIAEETVDARRRAPWGLVSSVVTSGIIGYALILSVTWVIPDIAGILNAQDSGKNPLPAILAIISTTLGSRTGTAVLWLVILSMWFCGLACVTSLSRTIYAFARDKGLPLSQLWSQISAEHHTPAPAVWLSVVLSFVILLYSDAMPVVASLCVLGFYLSYFIPIFLGWRRKKKWISQRGPWHLGRASNIINVLALVWIVCVCMITVMPPNALAGYALAGVIVVLYALHRFTGHHQVRKHEWELVGQQTIATSEES